MWVRVQSEHLNGNELVYDHIKASLSEYYFDEGPRFLDRDLSNMVVWTLNARTGIQSDLVAELYVNNDEVVVELDPKFHPDTKMIQAFRRFDCVLIADPDLVPKLRNLLRSSNCTSEGPTDWRR